MENLWAAVAATTEAGRTLRHRPEAARAARIRRGWTALPASEGLWRPCAPTTSRRWQDPLASQGEGLDLPRLRGHAPIELLEGFEHGRRRAFLQDLPWRRPK
eukprot:6834399-Pyramimonas_sp.AAC.1